MMKPEQQTLSKLSKITMLGDKAHIDNGVQLSVKYTKRKQIRKYLHLFIRSTRDECWDPSDSSSKYEGVYVMCTFVGVDRF